MNAAAAFSNREEMLLEQLKQAATIDAAISACTMALEQTACELAQDEQDEHARQRQQAVLALVRRAPHLLRAAAARGELIVQASSALPAQSRQNKLLRSAKISGFFLLGALAVYELIDGRTLFALLQLLGANLLMLSGRQEKAVPAPCSARGVATIDSESAVRLLRELCQAADICVSDLMLLDKDAGMHRLSGTADDAMLDLLTAMMEAKASGRDELAMRSLNQAEQYLHMLGVELLPYDAAYTQYFDTLPTMGQARTIRPAMMKDGKLLRRGVAALQAERSAGI